MNNISKYEIRLWIESDLWYKIITLPNGNERYNNSNGRVEDSFINENGLTEINILSDPTESYWGD